MSDAQESWAVVELLGHVTMAGKLSEVEMFGAKLGRLDVPTNEGGFTTVYFGGSSIYRLTPTTEAIARAKARSHQPRPISPYELPPAVESRRGLPNHADDDVIDPDFDPDDDIDEEDFRL